MKIGKASNQAKVGESVNVEVDGKTYSATAGNEINASKVLIVESPDGKKTVFSESFSRETYRNATIQRKRPKKNKITKTIYPVQFASVVILENTEEVWIWGDRKIPTKLITVPRANESNNYVGSVFNLFIRNSGKQQTDFRIMSRSGIGYSPETDNIEVPLFLYYETNPSPKDYWVNNFNLYPNLTGQNRVNFINNAFGLTWEEQSANFQFYVELYSHLNIDQNMYPINDYPELYPYSSTAFYGYPISNDFVYPVLPSNINFLYATVKGNKVYQPILLVDNIITYTVFTFTENGISQKNREYSIIPINPEDHPMLFDGVNYVGTRTTSLNVEMLALNQR